MKGVLFSISPFRSPIFPYVIFGVEPASPNSKSSSELIKSRPLFLAINLYNSFFVSRQSVKNDKMMSAYMSEFVSYNVLDQDYLDNKNNRLRRP